MPSAYQSNSCQVDDIFGPSAVTFGSPLADVSGFSRVSAGVFGVSGSPLADVSGLQFAQRPTNEDTHEVFAICGDVIPYILIP